MKRRTFRTHTRTHTLRPQLGFGLCMLLAGVAGACNGGKESLRGDEDVQTPQTELGSVRLSLTTRGPSGATYRLRQALFEVFQVSGGGGIIDVPPIGSPLPPGQIPIPIPNPPRPTTGPVTGTAGAASGGAGGAGPDDPAVGGAPGEMGGMGGVTEPPPPIGPPPIEPPPIDPFPPIDPPSFGRLLSSEDDPLASTLEATLPVGSFQISLFGGWFLEKIVDGEPVAVDARLVSPDFQFFDIASNEETLVVYRFETGGEIIEFAEGRLVVDIVVDEVDQPGGGEGAANGGLLEHQDTAMTVGFPGGLRQVLEGALSNAGSSLDPEAAYHSIIDSYATADGGRDPDAPHCDDELTNGAPSLNGYPLMCPRLEAEQFNALDSWFVTAAVNRLDLAPEDGSNCGQQRLVLSTNNFVGAGRMFVIVEAEVPNPSPECGVDACRPIAEFWSEISQIGDPVERGSRLSQAFLSGDPALLEQGFDPFIDATHLGPDGGQIRTNNFNDFIWTLREFHFPDVDSAPLPAPVAESPNGALWNDLSGLPQGEECRQSFTSALEGLVGDELGAMSFPVPEACKNSESLNDGSENYPNQLANGSGQFEEQLAIAAEPFGLTPQDIAARARFAGSCMGCHIESSGLPLGQGLTAPPREDFVHISEFTTRCENGVGQCFSLSSALTREFLPHRARVMSELLSRDASCGGTPMPTPPDPGPGVPPIEQPGEADAAVPAEAPRPGATRLAASQTVRTLGGQIATEHGH